MRRRRYLAVGTALAAAAATFAWAQSTRGDAAGLGARVDPSSGTVRWAPVAGADHYALDLAEGPLRIGTSGCGPQVCEVVLDEPLVGGSDFEVVAYADGRVLSRSGPLRLPAAPRAERPVIFDVVAVVEGSDGPEVRVHRASSAAEAEAVRERLRSDPAVVSIEPDSYADPGAMGEGRGGDLWAAGALNLAAAHSIAKGQGVLVAVVDSGVWAGHPDLRGRVLPGVDIPARALGLSRPGTRLATRHGTAVAGVIAAAGGRAGPLGVAPEAEILPVDVKGADDHIRTSSIAAGILWATRSGARVVNVSIAAPETSRAVSLAVAHASRRGALVVAGTGNKGLDSPDCSPRAYGEVNYRAYPAALADAVAVGGSTRHGRVWKCSHRGDYVDLVAPAAELRLLNNSRPRPHYVSSGTSFSAPAVAGAAALLLSVDPSLSRDRLVQLLETTATPGPDPEAYGRGLVSPHHALLALRDAGPAAPAPRPEEAQLVEDPEITKAMPPYEHLRCSDNLTPTTFVRAEDQYTRYTAWFRPPRRPILQGAKAYQDLPDSLIAYEIASRAHGHGPYSGPARSFTYGLGRSTDPADYTVTYDAQRRPSVTGPVVRLFPRGDDASPAASDLLQSGCRPDEAFESVPAAQATLFPGLDEYWYLEIRLLYVRDLGVPPGRYALLPIIDGFLYPHQPWNPPWWTSGRFPVVTVGPSSG